MTTLPMPIRIGCSSRASTRVLVRWTGLSVHSPWVGKAWCYTDLVVGRVTPQMLQWRQEAVPLRPYKTEKIYNEPGGSYQIGKVLRTLFSPRKVYSRGSHKTTIWIEKGREHMTNRLDVFLILLSAAFSCCTSAGVMDFATCFRMERKDVRAIWLSISGGIFTFFVTSP